MVVFILPAFDKILQVAHQMQAEYKTHAHLLGHLFLEGRKFLSRLYGLPNS